MAAEKASGQPFEPPPSYETAAGTPPTAAKQQQPQQQQQQQQQRTARPPPPPLDHPALNAIRTRRTILASASPRRRQLFGQVGIGPQHIECIPSAHPEDFPKYGVAPFEYVVQTAQAKAMAVYRAELNNREKGEPGLVIAADTVVVGQGGEILEKPRSEREHVEMLRALRDGTSVRAATAAAATAISRSGGGGELSSAVSVGLGSGMRGESAASTAAAAPASPAASATAASTSLRNGTASAGGYAASATAGWHKVYTGVTVMAPLVSARDPGYAAETAFEETNVKFDPTLSDEIILSYVRTREGADKAGGYGIQGIGTLLVEKVDGSWDNVVGLPLKTTLRLIEKVIRTADAEDPEDDESDEDAED